MSAVASWIRVDLRSRARSLIVLALLVALTTGVVLTAVAGARRGQTAVDRLLDRTRPATVAALPNQEGFDWAKVEALPEVEAIARFPVSSYSVEGLPPDTAIDFAYGDGIMDELERPVVLEGRLPDPTKVDEAVVTADFPETYGKGVGDTLTFRLLSPEQVDESYDSAAAPEPEGPVFDARIVGVVRSTWFSDTGSDNEGGGRVIPSRAVFDRYLPNLIGNTKVGHVNALVRLKGGAAAIPAFRDDLARVSGRRDIEFFNLAEDADHLRKVADFEAEALLAFAAAALVAALFLVGQAVTRHVAGTAPDLQILATMGMPPRHVRLGAATGPTLAAGLGTALGAEGAVAVSDRFPMGTVAPLEPAPGRHADWAVLAAGIIVVPVLVAAATALASRAAARRTDRATDRPSVVTAVASRVRLSVPVTVGSRFALERGRGPDALPIFPALVGAVVGVLGVVAALTFAAGVDDAATHPERFGQVARLETYLGFNGEDFVGDADPALQVLAHDPDTTFVNDTRQGVVESGRVDIPLFALDPVTEATPIVVTAGRPPTAADEVAIAPKTAADLGIGVGDDLTMTGSAGHGRYRVTAIAFVPEGSHNGYDSGAWILSTGYDDLVEGFKFHTALVGLRAGADPQDVRERLAAAVAKTMGAPPDAGLEMIQVLAPPSRLSELRQVQRLPELLAGFLTLLAVAAVGHALATAVRRRRRDLAVLRAIGITRAQSRLIVVTQATLLGLVGLAIGVPLGIALGRTLWRSVATTTPLEYVPPVALVAVAVIVPVVVVGANLLAAWPSQRAASMRAAHVLRTE